MSSSDGPLLSSILKSEDCVRALSSDLGLDNFTDNKKLGVGSPTFAAEQMEQLWNIQPYDGTVSPMSTRSLSESFERLTCMPTGTNSLGEDSYSPESAKDDQPELNVDSIHKYLGSPRLHKAGGVPKPKMLAHVTGTGLAPWEIHRPQRFVRDLMLRRSFWGRRVLDVGCGIGDNALYIAREAQGSTVTAVDVIPRCLEFLAAKAERRGMQGRVELVTGDVLETEPERCPVALGPQANGRYDVVLDSSTFDLLSDDERPRYVSMMRRLLAPGGLIYMNCMSEEETREGGPRRITVPSLLAIFNRQDGWEVETIEETVVEAHPNFWGGKGKARLFAIRKL